MRQTSLDAYRSMQDKQRRYNQICEVLARRGNMCNLEISTATGLPINCVTPRVYELREKGVIKDKGTKTGPSGFKVHVWGL